MRGQTFLFGHGARTLQAVNRGKRDFLLLGVLAGGFPESFGRLLDVEHVIHNLERQADMLAEAGERGELGIVGARVNRAHAHAGAQQRSGFGAVNGFEQRRGRFLAFAFQIVHLSADHSADRARRGRELGHQTNAPLGIHIR